MDAGLLRQLEPLTSSEVGRRRVPIDVQATSFLAAGVHIGREYTTYGLVDLRGNMHGSPHRVEHTDTDPRAIADQAVDVVATLIDDRPATARLIGTGVSLGGLVNHATGVVHDHPILGWHGVDVAELVGNRVPAPTVVDSTYRALARAEMWFGAAREVSSFIQLFLGYAIGGRLRDRSEHLRRRRVPSGHGRTSACLA